MAVELPQAGSPSARGERADAARNRERILAVAARLIEQRGLAAVSMQDVAEAAGVGPGTIYRRFGDRGGLAIALVDEQTRVFQDALLSGPPPLGPGAPAGERLVAFGGAYLDLLVQHAELFSAGDKLQSGAQGPRGFFATHVTILLREAAPALDAEFTAQALLGALDPRLNLHLRRNLGWPDARIREGWRGLVERVLG